MRVRYSNRKTGVQYRFVEALLFVPWLYRCVDFKGRTSYVAGNNLVRYRRYG